MRQFSSSASRASVKASLRLRGTMIRELAVQFSPMFQKAAAAACAATAA